MTSFLGPQGAFKHVYETPILASRQPGASPEEVELGESRAAELARLTSAFVLRRTQEINKKYLPPKGSFSFTEKFNKAKPKHELYVSQAPPASPSLPHPNFCLHFQYLHFKLSIHRKLLGYISIFF